MTVAKAVVTTIAVAGMLTVGAAAGSTATAAADTGLLPTEPLPIPDPPPAGYGSAPDYLLSQHATPAVPGSQPAGMLDLSQLNTSYLQPQNFFLAQQGQDSLYSVTPAGEGAPLPSGIDSLRAARGMWHLGMGQMPQDQLGEPLPGTAPLPGTNVPAGLGQNLPDPALPVPEGAPAPAAETPLPPA